MQSPYYPPPVLKELTTTTMVKTQLCFLTFAIFQEAFRLGKKSEFDFQFFTPSFNNSMKIFLFSLLQKQT